MNGMTRRTFLKNAGLASAAALLAACGSADAAAYTADPAATAAAAPSASPLPDDVSLYFGGVPEVPDPAYADSTAACNALLLCFEGLYAADAGGRPQPAQAESHTVSEDGLTHTFTLKSDLRWSDGSPLTAADYVYSFRRLCTLSADALYADLALGTVQGYADACAGSTEALAVSAPDDVTLQLRLESPCPYLEALLCLAALCPVQQAAAEQGGYLTAGESTAGCGAYRITGSEADGTLLLEKNPRYRAYSALTCPDTLRILPYAEPQQRLEEYEQGELALTMPLPADAAQDGADHHAEPVCGTCYLAVNCASAALQSADVRYALSLAADRSALSAQLPAGTVQAAYALIGPGMPDGDGTAFCDNGTPLPADRAACLAQAQQLLSGTELPGLFLLAEDSDGAKATAQLLCDGWAEAGITVKPVYASAEELAPARRAGEFDLALTGWLCDYPDPYALLCLFESTGANNDGAFADAEYDSLLSQSNAAGDETARYALLHAAEERLLTRGGCIPLAFYGDAWRQNDALRGFAHTPLGIFVPQTGQ